MNDSDGLSTDLYYLLASIIHSIKGASNDVEIADEANICEDWN